MPLFFFNHSSAGSVCVDDLGTEFPSLEAAYLDTCDAVLDMAFEKLRTQQDPEDDSFDIIDVEGSASPAAGSETADRPSGPSSHCRLPAGDRP